MIPQKDNRLSIPKSMDNLSIVRNKLRDFLSGTKFGAQETNRIILSVDEAITNIIEHGKSINPQDNIELEMRYDGESIEIIIEDNCEHFNPMAGEIANPNDFINEGKDGGMGIYSFRTLMNVRYESAGEESGNRIYLVYPKMERI